MALQLRPPGFAATTTYLVSTVGQKWLHGLLEFSAASPGLMASDQDREQCWPKMAGCMHSAAVASCRCQMQKHS